MWRDWLLLLSAWFVALASAIGAWASHSETIGQAGRLFGSTLWARGLLALHTAAVLALLVLPVVGTAWHLIPAARRTLPWPALSAHRMLILPAALAGLGLLQPLYLIDIGRFQFTLNFVATLLIVAIVLLLLYGEARPLAAAPVLALAWVVLVISTRLALQAIQQALRSQPGGTWATIWGWVFAVWMVLELILPFLLFIPRFRPSLASSASHLGRVPLWASAVVFLMAAVVAVVFRASGAAVTGLWAFQRLAGAFALIAACLVALRMQGPNQAASAHQPDLTVRWSWAAFGIIAVAYIIQAIRIGLNALYYLNPDGVAYMILARDFGRGLAVVRGYWAPLMSLIIAPAIRFGAEPQVAQRILAGVSGLAWVAATVLLGKRAGLKRIWLVILAATMSAVSLQLAFIPVTPDMLSAAILVCYFLLVTSDRFLDRPFRFGALAGVVGALAFYAKFYNLPFFVVHILLTGMFLGARGKGVRKSLSAVAAAWIVVGLLIVPWMLILRGRYGYLTLSTSGSINHALHGPSQIGHPCWDQRLCDKPTDVLIPWEDPQAADYRDLGWSVLGSWDNLRHQILLTQNNIAQFLGQMAFRLGPLPPLAMVFLLLGLFAFAMDERSRFHIGWGVMTVGLYVSGYLLFENDFRYFIPVVPIVVIAVFRAVQAGLERARGVQGERPFLLAECLTAAAIFLSFLSPSDAGLRSLPPNDHCVAVTTAQFADKLVAPIAGSDRWINIIAYYSEKRTLGVLMPTTSAPDANNEFLRLGVRTYVVGEGLRLGADLLARGDYTVAAETNLCGNRYLILRTPVP